MLPYAHTDWCGRLQYQPPSRTVVPYMDAGTGRYGLAKAPADRRAKVTHPCALSGTGSEMALLMLRLRLIGPTLADEGTGTYDRAYDAADACRACRVA